MAEDDEVDVLGDFNLDNILSKSDTSMFANAGLVSQNSDLLNCDYTIHPQWLLDRPSANPALWYNSGITLDTDLDTDLARQFEFTNEPHITTENSITDESGWTEKEKSLLNRGIEIFGKNNFNLSQFIGSRTPAEVKYFLKNFHSEVCELSCNTVNETVLFDNCIEETVIASNADDHIHSYKVLNEDEIPASIEEIISAVETAKPTVSILNRKRKKSIKAQDYQNSINYQDIPSGQSLLKSNYIKPIQVPPPPSIKLKDNNTKRKNKIGGPKKGKSVKFKFKTKLKVNNANRKVNKPHSIIKKVTVVKKSIRKSVSLSESENSCSDIQIVTGNGLSLPLCEGEEVIKIKKENETTDTDTDAEIDIEDSDGDGVDDKAPPFIHPPPPPIPTPQIQEQQIISKAPEIPPTTIKPPEITPTKHLQLNDLPKDVSNALTSMALPSAEVLMECTEISDVEKFIFHEFFEARPTKTPARYLKIRNHIISTWNAIKPNYVTKTSIRQGLKQAGDVNCIGRIHNYLEQIAAINFGCTSFTNYVRPLYDLATNNTALGNNKERPVSCLTFAAGDQSILPRSKQESLSRPRNKKKYINDGEGGCTLTHDERGDIIDTRVVNEEPVVVKPRAPYIKKPPSIRLIYCRPITNAQQEHHQYRVRVDLSALILMDLHAHMYMSEVMGLVGGHWDGEVLAITRYEPCKNIAASSTHCDMCPISQARAADVLLHEESLDILGWFHSHPTFAPEPSQQDLDTQLSVQQWIGHRTKPCVGVILSPFSLNGALIASPYRCLVVDKKASNSSVDEEQLVPYKFKVDLCADNVDVALLLKQAARLIHTPLNDDSSASTTTRMIDFMKVYFQDHNITHLDKYLYSIKMHLAKCSGINKMTCDAIIQGLSDICSKRYSHTSR